MSDRTDADRDEHAPSTLYDRLMRSLATASLHNMPHMVINTGHMDAVMRVLATVKTKAKRHGAKCVCPMCEAWNAFAEGGE